MLLWQVADGDDDSVGDDGQDCQLVDVVVVVVFEEVLGADDDGDDEGGCGGGEALPMPLLPVETDGALLPILLLQLLLLFGKTTATCAGPVLMFCEVWRLLFLLFFCLLAVCFLLVNERKISPK